MGNEEWALRANSNLSVEFTALKQQRNSSFSFFTLNWGRLCNLEEIKLKFIEEIWKIFLSLIFFLFSTRICLKVCALSSFSMIDWLSEPCLYFFSIFLWDTILDFVFTWFYTQHDYYAHRWAGVGRVWSVCFREVSIFKVRRLWGISSYFSWIENGCDSFSRRNWKFSVDVHLICATIFESEKDSEREPF